MLAPVLLLAALASAQDALKEIEALLRQAEASVAAMESLGTKEKPACPSGVDLATIIQDFNGGRLGAVASRLLLGDRASLVEYYACRALAADSSEPCAALRPIKISVDYQGKADKKGLQRPETLEFLCMSAYTDLAVAKGGISGDKAMIVRACKEHDAAGHRDFKPEQLDNACRLLADKFGDPEAICSGVAPLFRTPVAQKYCVNEMRMAMGDARACRSLTEPEEKRFCAAASSYRKAFLAKSAAQCGESALCRAMMGAADSCEPLGLRAAGAVCFAHYNFEHASKEHASVTSKLGRADKLLSAIDPAKLSGEAASVVALEERLEKAARLRHRADQAMKRFSPPSLWKAESR